MTKRRKAKDLILINVFIYILLMATTVTGRKCRNCKPAKKVNDVRPKHGSMGGATRLTITGEGFSTDQNKSPNIKLISRTYFPCEVVPELSNEKTIQCDTSPMVGDTYTVRVGMGNTYFQPKDHCSQEGKTDGFHSDCQMKTDEEHTPRIHSIYPRSQSNIPGQIIKIAGKIISGFIGADTPRDEIKNGVIHPIARVYAGAQHCDMKNNENELYGVTLDKNGESKTGSFRCKMNGTFIGNSKVEFIVGGDYGRSLPNPKLLKVAANGEIYLFQTYPIISGLSHTSGSREGDLTLTIQGKYFDPKLPTKVMIAGSNCTDPKVEDSTVTCTTGTKSSWPSFPGNRGVLLERWTNTPISYQNLPQVSQFTGSSNGYSKRHIDELYHEEKQKNSVYRLRALLVLPNGGDYTILVRGKSAARVYLTYGATDDDDENKDPTKKTEVVTMPTSSTTFKSSDRLQLKAGVQYYLEVLHRGESLEVGLKHFNTSHTNDKTGLAKQEKQKLKFKSTIVREIQKIKLSQSSKVETGPESVNEIQKVTVKQSKTSIRLASFKLGMYGVYTDWITSSDTAEEVAEKIMALPLFDDHESIKVNKSDLQESETERVTVFSIGFNSERGNFSLFDVKKGESPVTISVVETTLGKPSGKYLAIQHEGIPAPLIKTTASVREVSSALGAMYGSRCSKLLTDPQDSVKFFFDFENSLPYGVEGKLSNKVEPFCGRKVVQNPTYLFKSTSTTQLILKTKQSTVCFAYIGNQLQDKIRLDYSYLDDENYMHDSDLTLFAEFETSLEWHYHCLDVLDEIKKKQKSAIIYYLRMIKVFKKGDIDDFFIDNVLIGRKPVSDLEKINEYRMRPALPNGGLIDSFEVTSSEGGFNIKLIPYGCAFDFPLIKEVPGQNLKGTVKVEQVKKASPPLTGTFKVSFRGSESKDFQFDIKGKTLAMEMEGLDGIGNLHIERKGSCSTFEYIITFLSLPGDVEQIGINGDNIKGVEKDVTSETIVNGHLQYETIPGDLMRTFHNKPQVSIVMGGIPAKCTGDCGFTWEEDKTPTLQGSSPCCGGPGTEITLTGTGFDPTPGNNVVTIGNDTCEVTGGNEDGTELKCKTPSVPKSKGQIKVNVKDKGYAEGSLEFTFIFGLTDFSPKRAKLGGGITLTCNGYGFDTEDITVTVGGKPCDVTSDPSVTTVKCTLPPNPAGKHKIKVTTGTEKQSKEYTEEIVYYKEGTPIIQSMKPQTTGVAGGGQMVITGEGFGGDSKVYFGNKEIDVKSTDTVITGTIPPNENGDHKVYVVKDDGTGAAVDSNGNVPTMKYLTVVTHVHPLIGSYKGGTRVWLTGQGFGNKKDDVKVKFGDTKCDVETVEDKKIVCLIEYTGKIIKITNQGKNKLYGVGYAWDPTVVSTEVGDFVEWTWTTPFYFADNFRPKVMQTFNRTTTAKPEDGFESLQSPNGKFKYEMTKTGQYDYSTDYIEEYEIIKYAGTVNVKKKEQTVEDLIVEVGGQSAQYDINSGVSTSTSTGDCPETIDLIPGCTEAPPTGGTTGMFNFKFQTCSTPILTNININEGTTMDEIIITGEGFSSVQCQNEVLIGSDVCKVTSSSDTQIKCKVDPAGSPKIGVRREYKVKIINRGNALNSMTGQNKRTLVLLPMISELTPTEVSLNGGTTLTIKGSGFHGDDLNIMVYIDQQLNMPDVNHCDVQSVTYTEIVCITPSLMPGKRLVEVIVRTNDVSINSICKRDPSCELDYQLSATPEFTNINPEELNGDKTKVTIDGSGFGSVKGNVMVTIGGVECEVIDPVNDDQIQCEISNVPVGTQTVMVINKVKGQASNKNDKEVTSLPVINSIKPTKGSTNGGTMITITGNGFTSDTTVEIDGATCAVKERTLSEVVCENMEHKEQANVPVVIVASGQKYHPQKFDYLSSVTPVVRRVSFPSNKHGDTIKITGSGFSGVSNDITVTIGSAVCKVTQSDSKNIKCTAPSLPAGTHKVVVHVAGKGRSNNGISVDYKLILSSISKTSGSVGGGQRVTLTGSGFDDTTVAKVCNEKCNKDKEASQTAAELICFIPPVSDSVDVTKVCSVEVSSNDIVSELQNAYTYKASLTPTIKSIDPSRGGTGGGVTLNIEGSGFGSDMGAVDVSIAGTPCTDVTVTPTLITCKTGQHSPSIIAKVKVEINKNGDAVATDKGKDHFQYIDVWSSKFTWGGQPPPAEGEMAVVTEGQYILLDVSTPVLKALLIQGGQLIFDEADIELHAEIILITGDGKLTVGTEDKPFEHKATITLHGHVRSKELPVYGTKGIGLRNGTIDLHGKRVKTPWTLLAETATSDTNKIKLKEKVTWKKGDKIVIASTSMGNSVQENEEREIASIESDGYSIMLTEPLKYTHLGVSEVVDDKTVEYRAEVGLLTRNVIVKGSIHDEWKDKIEACPEGFHVGQSAVQTCFQGRFGEEIGYDQFGAQIMIHPPSPNGDPNKEPSVAVAKIENVELYYVGQAFRVGRNPIHFLIVGEASKSYIKSCAIHKSFNRAINIQGTHKLLFENNVVYDIMGAAITLEDGIETRNIISYNLAIGVIASTTLQNDDITPAAFMIRNPNNPVVNNHAAGGTHFGFWYRLEKHPRGTSRTDSINPVNEVLGSFDSNTAHSLGWYGLWIFERYHPKVNGKKSGKSILAKFTNFLAWHCEKGMETIYSGTLQYRDSNLVHNKIGAVMKVVTEGCHYCDSGALMTNLFISGKSSVLPRLTTTAAIVLPLSNRFVVKNVIIKGYPVAFRIAEIPGRSGRNNGGFLAYTKNLILEDVTHRMELKHDHHAIIQDKDGSLIGDGEKADWSVVPKSGIIPIFPDCEDLPRFTTGKVQAVACKPNVRFTRFSFHKISPGSLNHKMAKLTDEEGRKTSNTWELHRMTHGKGWMFILMKNRKYHLDFEKQEFVTNISFTGKFYLFEENDWVIFSIKVARKPDCVQTNGKCVKERKQELDPHGCHGDWKYEPNERTVSYLVTLNKNCGSRKRKKRSTKLQYAEIDIKFKLYKCRYKDCIVPKFNEAPLIDSRPSNGGHGGHGGYTVKLWSKSGSWPDNVLPTENWEICVTIKQNIWMVADIKIPPLKCLILHGVLELDDSQPLDFEIRTGFILITKYGRLIAGFDQEHPFRRKLRIILRGNHTTENYVLKEDGLSLGKKFIAVFGGLDLHGKHVDPIWTTLGVTGNVGDQVLTVNKEVDWVADDEIVVTTTGYNARETETFKLMKVTTGDGKSVLKLDKKLKYKHLVYTQNINDHTYTIQTEVGLLSRSIIVEGDEQSDKESFGGMITAGLSSKGSGFMRITYTELRHMGQEGFYEPYDPHYPIAFVDTGKPTKNRPATVYGNSIHHCYSAAIGVYNMNNLKIESNVIYSTVRYAIHTTSDNTQLKNNMISVVLFPGTYRDRYEDTNIIHDGAISAMTATNLVLVNNTVSGAERVCYHVHPQGCGATTGLHHKNIARTCLIGVAVFPDNKMSGGCQKITGFNIQKSIYYSIYYNNVPTVQIVGVSIGDSTAGIFAMVIGPEAKKHFFEDKYVLIKKALVVGMSSVHDCNIDRADMEDPNIKLAKYSRPDMNRIVGVFPGQFTSSHNLFPFKLASGIENYPTIKGITKVEDVTFSGFSNKCSKTASAISTNPNNEDGQHPVEVKGVKFVDVATANKVHYHVPIVNKIDDTNCGDMACDAMKKMLIVDKDGSIGKTPGTIIPKSEMNWDVDKRFGIGDFRIPKTMVTTTTGKRIDVDDLAKYKGIIRDKSCTYNNDWYAYWCPKMNHKMLIVESMDVDSETRRIAPLGFLGKNGDDAYIDLINGPQDHGWCGGYNCRTRLSTFMLLAIPGKFYRLHFTGTTPLGMKHFLLNSNENEAIVLSVWYAQPFRLDVYYKKRFVLPKNGVWKAKDGKRWFNLLPEEETNQYLPLPNDPAGSNWFNRDANELYVVVRGSSEVEIKTVPDAIFVSFKYAPEITVDNFFGERIVEFMMEFFGLTEDKLRVTKIISASSRRRKRSTEGGVLVIEISNGPAEELGGKVPNPLSMEDLLLLYSKAVDEGQLGNFSYVLNCKVVEVSVAKPIIDPNDPSWATVNVTTPEGSYRILVQVENLAIHQDIVPNWEGLPFKTQPIIKVLDTYGTRISELGTKEYPWFLTATLTGGNQSAAKLIGKTTVQFVDGWATFTDLGINHYGTGYVINFAISSPAIGQNYTVSSAMLTIPARLIDSVFLNPTPIVYEQTELDVMFELVDSTTELPIENIEWRDHVWIVEAEFGKPELYEGSLIGTKHVRFDPSDARASLSLQFSTFGMYVIRYHITSTPLDYEYHLEYTVIARGQHHEDIISTNDTKTTEITLNFPGDYTTIVGHEENYLTSYFATWYAQLFRNVELLSASVSSGILVTLTINGTTLDVNETILTTCEIVKNDTTLLSYNGYNLTLNRYMLVDGIRICKGEVSDDTDDLVFLLPVIICCSLIGIAMLIILIFFIWKYKVHPKTKTQDIRNLHKNIEIILSKEKSFMNIGNEVKPAPMATDTSPDKTDKEVKTAPKATNTSLARMLKDIKATRIVKNMSLPGTAKGNLTAPMTTSMSAAMLYRKNTPTPTPTPTSTPTIFECTPTPTPTPTSTPAIFE